MDEYLSSESKHLATPFLHRTPGMNVKCVPGIYMYMNTGTSKKQHYDMYSAGTSGPRYRIDLYLLWADTFCLRVLVELVSFGKTRKKKT